MNHPAAVPVVAKSKAALVEMSFRDSLARLLPELGARALRLAGSASAADDLVQDTCERALRFEGQYERGTNLRAWLHQILFSVFVTRYRKTTRERNALRKMGIDPSAWSCEDRFVRPEAALTLTASVERMLETLPLNFREAIAKVDLDQKSYGDAAAELDVPVGTVMSRLHRGRKLLASMLACEGPMTALAA